MAETLSVHDLAADPARYHLIDVRGAEDYEAAHVSGAVHIPLAKLTARMGEIPADLIPVAVCGKGGGRSTKGAALLRANGHGDALALEGGTLAWLATQSEE